MGVLLIRANAQNPRTIDSDTIRFINAADTDLSHYFDINIDHTNNLIDFLAKIGDFRFRDPDDAAGIDALQITSDPASGGILQNSSRITAGNIWSILTSGIVKNLAGTINLLNLDTDGYTIDDDTAATTLRVINIDLTGMTETEIAATTLEGIKITMPTQSSYFGSSAIYCSDAIGRYVDILTEGNTLVDISAIVSNASSAYIPLSINRSISGDITANRALTSSSIIAATNNHNAAVGDFDLTFASSLMSLTMQQMCDTTVGAKTDPDVFSATVIDIDIDATTTTATAKLDASPRAINIAYTLTETLGELRMADTDIFRIIAQLPTGLSSAGAFNFDMMELNADSVVLNDANISFEMLKLDASGMTNTSSALAVLMSIISADDSDLSTLLYINGQKGDVSLSERALIVEAEVSAAITADRAISSYRILMNSEQDNTSAGDFDLTDAADSGLLSMTLGHTAATTVGAKTNPDVLSGKALNIAVYGTTNNINTKLDVSARAIDISYLLTETAGTLRLAATDIARIVATIPNGITSAGAFQFDMFEFNGDNVVVNDANLTFTNINIDNSSMTLTTGTGVYGTKIQMPLSVGVALNRAAIMTSDGANSVYLSNGSMGVSATGINEERYYYCDDFDYEAAAVTLDAGLRGDEWTFGGTNGSVDDVTFVQAACGAIRIETDGAHNDSVCCNHLSTNIYSTDNPIMEVRFRTDSVTASFTACMFGFTETINVADIANFPAVSNDYICIGLNSETANPANIKLLTDDATGGEIADDTGVAVAANQWVTVRIDCSDVDQPRVFINATGGAITPANEIAAALITGTIQAGIYMFPFLFVQGQDATPSARHVDVDYVKIWQNRA